MRITKLLLLAAAILLAPIARADEGMWLLPLLKKYNAAEMQKLGLKLAPEDIYSPNQTSLKDAIVIFGNGCTGEVVSSKGLVLTNHHCGYGAIQKHSTVEHDYLKDGFWAQSFDEEIPTPGLTVTFLISIQDVTDEITKGLAENLSERERNIAIGKIADSLENVATEGNHYKATVDSFYGGNQFYLLVYEVFNDIRMVGAPPSSIGKFGADTDNWMYPRHTGDFALFRIYADKDNKPAAFSPENQPYKPRKSLTLSIAGYEEGDFAMIMGYPGSTDRYMTSWEVEQTMSITNTDRAHIRGIKQEIWMRHMESDPAIRIKYSSKYAGSANYWKNAIGQNEALKRLKVVEEKKKIEQEFQQWVMQNPERETKYGQALQLIEQSVEELNTPMHYAAYYSEALFQGCEFNRLAGDFRRLESALRENDTAIIALFKRIGNQQLEESWFKDYDLNTDKETTKAMLKLFKKEMPSSVLPDIYNVIDKKFKGNIDRFVDKLFETSIMVSHERIKRFMEKPNLKTLEKDLGYQFALSTRNGLAEVTKKLSEARFNLRKGHRIYIAGQLEMLEGKPSYPDANFSMRLTYGTIQGYKPRDGVSYNYYTTTQGIIEKENPDEWEFIVPERLKELHELKDFERYGLENSTMPVNFLTTNDITGGNSGSPVLNGHGHLIGVAFDGNWESLSGDIAFEKEMQRCINVDIRYVLFVIDKFAGCTRLLDEMKIVK